MIIAYNEKYKKKSACDRKFRFFRHLVDALKKNNVNLFDIKPSRFKSKMIKNSLVVSNKELISKAVKGCEAIFHFVAVSDIDTSSKNPTDTIQTNGGTINLINEALNKILID